jgi:orotidine-5'-phosphate decarboxylase
MHAEARDRLIVALDVATLDEAAALVRELHEHVGCFKVGLELLTAAGGAQVVELIHAQGGRLFYDAKFSDIPNTVAGAARGAAARGVWMFSVHASCGRAALTEAVANRGSSLVLAVTVLTSLDDAASAQIFGAPAREKVLQLAQLAAESGVQGIVCSPHELALLRASPALAPLPAVVPGIRPAWAAAGDQARIMTPQQAIAAGASAVVVGRPVTRPPDQISRAEAARRIIAEIAAALDAGWCAPPVPQGV